MILCFFSGKEVNLKHLLAEEKKKGIFAAKRLPCQPVYCYNWRSCKKHSTNWFLHCNLMILLDHVADYETFYLCIKIGAKL